MKLLYIKLVNHKCWALNNINELEWDVQSDTQLIIGTNGSGKSTLLRELNPLPSAKPSFSKGGLKITKWEHRGSTYEITSDFTKGIRHSFKREGEELNPSSTGAVQKELVKEHFNYTDLINKVLLGDIHFNKLSPSQRKDLLMTINPLDFAYAMNLFDKLKNELRDQVGIEKHLSSKVVETTRQLEALEDSDYSEKDRDALENKIESLLQFRTNGSSPADIKQQIKEAISTIGRERDTLKSIRLPYSLDETTPCMTDLNTKVALTSQLIDTKQKDITLLQQDLLELNASVTDLGNGEVDIDTLQKRHKDVKEQLRSVKVSVNPPFGFDANYRTSSTNYHAACYTKLASVVGDESLTKFTTEQHESIDGEYTKVKETIKRYEWKLGTLKEKQKHYEEELGKQTVCPKCQYNLNSEDGIEGLMKDNLDVITRGIKALDELKDKLPDLEAKVSDSSKYRKVFLETKEILYSFNLPTYLKNALGNVDDIIANITDIGNHFAMADVYVSAAVKVQNYESELRNLESAIWAADNNVSQQVRDKEQRLQLMLSEIEELKYTNSYGANKLKVTEAYQASLDNLNLVENKLNDLLKEYTSSVIDASALEIRSGLINDLHKVNTAINREKLLQANLDSLESDLKDCKEKKESLKVLVESLSANKGIMADQMLGFINSYVGDMNAIISSIWSHSLTIGSCNMDNGNLDYKFPLNVHGRKASEISTASTGQGEVINFAFVVVLRSYLDLLDYPMFLDEVGSGFDETHRQGLVKFIKSIMETKQCSQNFMVSHYSSVHGGLTNLQTVVLDSTNIVTPKEYNTSFKIKRGNND